MIELSGRGHGQRAVMGVAVRLTLQGGRPTLEAETLARLGQRRLRGDEPLDIILVAEDPATALLTPLPGSAHLVGVLAEGWLATSWLATSPDSPTVLDGVGGVLDAVSEGAYLLLDPERGRALIEPTAQEIVRLQRTRRPRILLGPAHDPAQTLSRRTVAVWGIARSLPMAREALAQGADGLFWEGDAEEATLLLLAREFGGGALALREWPEPEELLALADRCELRCCLEGGDDPEALRAELEDTLDALRERGASAAMPKLVASLSAPPEVPDGWDAYLCLDGWLPDDILEAPPLYALLDESESGLEDAVAAGAVALIALPERVRIVKDAIRTQP